MKNPHSVPSPRAQSVLDYDRHVFTLLRRLFWTAAVAVVGVALGVAALHVVQRRSDQRVRHERDVARMAREARGFATDRQTGVRGFLLTLDSTALEHERRARPRLTIALDSLVAMTARNPEQYRRASAMRAAMIRWDRYYAQLVLASPVPPPGTPPTAMRDRELAGKGLFDEFREATTEFLREEEALYAARVRHDNFVALVSLLGVLIALSGVGVILSWMYSRVERQTTELLEQQAQLEEQAVELEVGAAEIQATNEQLEGSAVELVMANDELRTSVAEVERSRASAERANDKLESMLDRVADGFIELDADWRITYLNKAAAAIGGQALEDVRGKSHWDVYPASVGSEADRQYRKAMAEQTPVSFTMRYQEPATKVDVSVAVNAYPSPQALSILFRDITKQKRAEEMLARRDYQFSEAQRVARLGSWEYEVATSLNTWSEEMCRVLGQPENAVASLDTFLGQVVDTDRARVKAAVDQVLAGGEAFAIECRLRWPDGTVHTVHARGSANRDENGKPARIVGTVQDITERRQLQEQLEQSQKMEAVGQLAGGVAHDFNNVLTAIKSFSELVAIELPDDSPLRSDVREITASADRAAALTRQLLAFSRRQIMQPVVLDLNAVVEGVTKLLTRLLGVEVRCETALARGLGRVLADPGQIEQVLVNLAVNARDAMPDGGTLTLETANVSLDERHASRLSGVEAPEPGDYVVLTVSDTGEGMDSDTQSRIFEPFFTTKEAGKGTGLGLSTVYGIVRQSGGYVSVYSEVGRGTAFRVYLPRVTGDVHVPLAKPAAAPPPTNGRETILLVDDDEAVRTVATRILSRAGYTVLPASTPREAETIWAEHDGPIHLLMTDLMMPDMNGGQLASRLLEARPTARVLYTSGYTNETVIRRGLIIQDMPFLAKPFTMDEVVRKVREAIGTSTGPHAP